MHLNLQQKPKLHLKCKITNVKSIVIPKKPIIVQDSNYLNFK